MKTIFLSFDLWEYIEDGYDEPEDTTTLSNAQKQQLKENKKKDAKALSIIQQGVADTIFPRIINATKAKEAWDILQKEFRTLKVRDIKIQSLRRDFENMKMKDRELLKDYFSRLMEIVNQMKTYGEPISDQRIVEKILISLPESYNPIVTIVEETKEIASLSVEELMGSIKTYEKRLSRHSEKSVESAFQSKLNVGAKPCFDQPKGESSRGGRHGRGRGRSTQGRGRNIFERRESNEVYTQQKCSICKRSSHIDKDCWFRGKPQCHNCKKFGHVQKDCRFKNNQQANFTEEQESDGNLFYTCQSA